MIDKSLLTTGRLGEMITMALGEDGEIPPAFTGPSKLPPSEQVRPVEPTTAAVGEEDSQAPVAEQPARPIATTMAVGEEDGVMSNLDRIKGFLPEGVAERLFPTAPTNYPVQEAQPAVMAANPFIRALPQEGQQALAALPQEAQQVIAQRFGNPFMRPVQEQPQPAAFDPNNLQNMTPAELLIQARNIFRRDS